MVDDANLGMTRTIHYLQTTLKIMDHFNYKNRELFCEDVAIAEIAQQFGTPTFVYSQATLLHHLKQLQTAFEAADPIICYSVKTNGNLALCRLMAEHGTSFDVTSGGELYRALHAANGNACKIVFAGVGKTRDEMIYALKQGVYLFNVESEHELQTLGEVATSLNIKAPVALRVNPDLPPKTHVKTDTSVKGVKFGLDIETVLEVSQKYIGHPMIEIVGLHMHLGSPILSTEPYKAGGEKALQLIDAMRKQGHPIRVLNMGGGFGVHYRKQEALPASAFAEVLVPIAKQAQCQLVLEPGRFIVANAGILLSRVLYNKSTGGKNYLIQDAAMNDLLRPTLYDSFHRIWPVNPKPPVVEYPDDFEAELPHTLVQDVVGPVCESGDFLAKGRRLPRWKRAICLRHSAQGPTACRWLQITIVAFGRRRFSLQAILTD